MKTTFYLIVNQGGTVTVRKQKPSVDFNEVALLVALELPNTLFTRPALSAQIKVDDPGVPLVINAVTETNIKEAIEKVTGMTVNLNVVDDREEKNQGGKAPVF